MGAYVVGEEARGDRDSAGVVRIRRLRHGTEDRLGVGARQAPQHARKPGKLALVLHAMEELLGVVGASGHHDLLRREGPRAPREAARALGGDRVATTRARLDGGHRRERMDHGTGSLSQAKVVLGQGVLGVMPAAGHALPALGAPCALGTDTTEERIGRGHTGTIPEVDAHRSHLEGVAHTHLIRNSLHDDVTGGHGRVGDNAKHARSLVVVGGQLTRPVSDVRPLLVLEEPLGRHVEGVGIDKGTPTHSRACEDHDVLEHMDALDAGASEGRGPQEAAQAPRGLGEVGIVEAPPGFEHADAVALLRQTKRGDRPAEARAHDEDVIVEAGHHQPPCDPSSACLA